MKVKTMLMTVVVGMPLMASAQNPIVHDQFCADPTARVFNDKVYFFPSHDIPAPKDARQDWFCMADYHVFSSENLFDWQDHGMIISQEQVPWGNPTGYAMWAPDCVFKKSASAPNGKYYFYFPNAPKGGRGFAIGVATADKPEGPYTLEQEPIKGVSGIDPCVLLDDDGSAYIYWSGMGIRGAKLKDNMKELDGELQEISMPRRQGNNGNAAPQMPPMRVGGVNMEGLPDGFKEGPFVFKRNGWYYLTFPWVRKEGGTETLAYSMSKSPLGPWDFKGIFMAEHDNGCWTNHHSFVEYRGQWYLFYHRNYYSPSKDKMRSACIEKVTFNADGTIQEVKRTLRGVGIAPATSRLDIDRYSAVSAGTDISYIDTTNYFRGWSVDMRSKGNWVQFNDVDFSSLNDDAYVIVTAKATENTEFCIRENSPKGKVLARIKMTVKSEQPRTGGQGAPRPAFRRDQSGQWIQLTSQLDYIPKGVANLVVTCEGEGVSIDWVRFKNRPDYFSAVSTASSQPDEQGFIRRWMLLEPIKQDIRSNTVFTDTWLREVFTKTYFKDQMTIMPRDGQKVKADKQSLTWHALESNMYNVKLFRFAEKWGQQTYGSLFWGVTVIDCQQDINNVRLAAGSNGASIWWLNDEEVLLLSGDRRMVEDDGMSPRLTLKAGRNVLRCAVINGPGLSDMCVRFIDENGKPVTNFEIK